jgi:hypothetical protein
LIFSEAATDSFVTDTAIGAAFFCFSEVKAQKGGSISALILRKSKLKPLKLGGYHGKNKDAN